MTDLLLPADLLARPMPSYVIRTVLCFFAYFASLRVESVVARVIGFVYLLLAGGGLLLMGISHGTAGDLVLGVVALGAAAYSWWFTRC